jgi:phosphohistidine phosphatase SixA
MAVDKADFELYLLRHADAGDPAAWKGDDALRPLSEKGEKQARRIGRLLADSGFKPDAIVSSPKVRALKTAEIFGHAVGVAVDVDDRLGGLQDLDELGDVVVAHGGSRVVVVGHDPDFSELAAELAGVGRLPMKKGAIVRIDTSLPLRAGRGTLRWLVPPDIVG